MNCPNDHGEMKKKASMEAITFRGKDLQVLTEHYVCSECGIRVDDLPLASRNQKALSDVYRKAVNMLTSDDIVQERKRKAWTQEDLARAINVGIASIKRWEKGQIQNKAMDDALRRAFGGEQQPYNPHAGNRRLSVERIKLVLKELGARLGRPMPEKGSKFLYEGKYLFYLDMGSFKTTGRSMTGATFARLTKGPQLNNYRDLVGTIRDADDSAAEPLREDEIRIIERIAMKYPTNKSIYQASHREIVWQEKKDGELIPYSDAERITGI